MVAMESLNAVAALQPEREGRLKLPGIAG